MPCASRQPLSAAVKQGATVVRKEEEENEMTLRTKLLCSFASLLVLLLVVAGYSWNGMDQMNRRAEQRAMIGEALTHLLNAQAAQLRMVADEKLEYLKDIRENLQEAQTHIRSAAASTVNVERRKAMEAGIAGMDEFNKRSTTLAEDSRSIAETMKGLRELADGIEQDIERIRDVGEKAFRENGSIQEFEVYDSASQMLREYFVVRQNFREYQINPSPELLQSALAKLDVMEKAMEDCQEHLIREVNKKAMLSIMSRVTHYREGLETLSGQINKRAKDIMSAREFAITLANEGEKLAEVSQKLMLQSQQEVRSILLMVAVGSLLLGCLLTWWLSRNVQRQLGADPAEVAHLAERVTNGDYDIDDGRPHLGLLHHLVQMVAALKEHIATAEAQTAEAHRLGEQATRAMEEAKVAQAAAENAKREGMLAAADQLEGVVAVCSSASEELSAQIEQSERGATEQAARISETAAAVDEMNSTVLEVAKNAGAAAEESASTKAKAEEGATVVNEVVAAIGEVQTNARP